MARPKKVTIEEEAVPVLIEEIVAPALKSKSEKEKLLELYEALKARGIDTPSKLEVLIANAE